MKQKKIVTVSVTRFGKIWPLFKILTIFGVFLGLLSIWQNVEPTLATFFTVVNLQILN